MKTRDEKLSEIDAKLKRWLARGMRAQTAINKLLKQQARLKKMPVVKSEPPGPDPFDNGGRSHSLKDDDAFAIPADLKVTTDVEVLRAERRKREAAERHAMPLTGKAALDHIRRKK